MRTRAGATLFFFTALMITVVTAELVFDPVPFFAPYCDTMTFTWSEGQAPYTIRISTPDMVYALQSDITATSVGWVANAEGSRVDTADGGELTAWVRDASGSTAYSMKFGLYNTVSDNGVANTPDCVRTQGTPWSALQAAASGPTSTVTSSTKAHRLTLPPATSIVLESSSAGVLTLTTTTTSTSSTTLVTSQTPVSSSTSTSASTIFSVSFISSSSSTSSQSVETLAETTANAQTIPALGSDALPSPTATSEAASETSSNKSSQKPSTMTMIAGATAAGFFALVGLGVLFFILHRRRGRDVFVLAHDKELGPEPLVPFPPLGSLPVRQKQQLEQQTQQMQQVRQPRRSSIPPPLWNPYSPVRTTYPMILIPEQSHVHHAHQSSTYKVTLSDSPTTTLIDSSSSTMPSTTPKKQLTLSGPDSSRLQIAEQQEELLDKCAAKARDRAEADTQAKAKRARAGTLTSVNGERKLLRTQVGMLQREVEEMRSARGLPRRSQTEPVPPAYNPSST